MARRGRDTTDILGFDEPTKVVTLHDKPAMPLSFVSHGHSTERRKATVHLDTLSGLGEFANHLSREVDVYLTKYDKDSLSAMLSPIRMVFESLIPRLGTLAPTDIDDWDKHDWWTAAHEWARQVKGNPTITVTTRNHYVLQASRILEHLQQRGFIPSFALPRGIKNAGSFKGRKLSFPEVVLADPDLDLDTIRQKLANQSDEVKELWGELSEVKEIRANPGIVLHLIDYYIEEIRNAAEAEIRSIYDGFLWAEKAIAETEIGPIREFLAENDGRTNRSAGMGRGSRSIFTQPRRPGEKEKAPRRRRSPLGQASPFANLLRYLEDEYGGLVPAQKQDPQLYWLITNKYGIEFITRHLALTSDTALPFCLILLITLKMNVSGLFTMKENCAKDGVAPGHKSISWYKTRPRPKLITKEVPESSLTELKADEGEPTEGRREPGLLEKEVPSGSAAELRLHGGKRISAPTVVDCLRSMRVRLAPHVFSMEKDLLLLVRSLGGPKIREKAEDAAQPLSDQQLRAAWGRFKARVPAISGLPIRLDQIRTTMLLKVALETKNILAVQDEANHVHAKTSALYVATHVTTAVNSQKIREVQDMIFVAATDTREDLQAKFGINAVEEIRSRNKARNFGINCKDNLAGTAPGSKPGKECGDSEYCPFCSQGYVVESVETATESWAFHDLILAQAPRLERESPDRWTLVWAPILAFHAKILSQMSAFIRVQGKELAANLDLSNMILE